MSDLRCQLCGTGEVFRTRLWLRDCLSCDESHAVCGPCLSDWGLRLEDPSRVVGRDTRVLRHRDCPDTARVARELMRPEREGIDPSGFQEMQERIGKAAKDCFGSAMKDFTDVAEVLKDTFKMAGADFAEVAEAATLLATTQIADAVCEAVEEAKA